MVGTRQQRVDEPSNVFLYDAVSFWSWHGIRSLGAHFVCRYRNTPLATNEDQPGGQFTMGGTNSSLYDGDINFVDLVQALYWTIPMTSLGVENGDSIQLSGSQGNAAIDTGTTLIGGPSSVLEQFYAQIDGATPGEQVNSQLQDYYVIRTLTSSLS